MNQPNHQPGSGSRSILTSISAGLIIIAVISLVFVGYTELNPHVTTLTQQQLVTNTQRLHNTQTLTVTSIGTQTITNMGAVTSVGVATSTGTPGYGSSNYRQFCAGDGCYCSTTQNYVGFCYSSSPVYYSNGNFYPSCQSTGSDNTVRCSGYLYQPDAGCVELAVPIDNAYGADARVYQYYTLRNLPSSYTTPGWNWVTVTGQITQDYIAAHRLRLLRQLHYGIFNFAVKRICWMGRLSHKPNSNISFFT